VYTGKCRCGRWGACNREESRKVGRELGRGTGTLNKGRIRRQQRNREYQLHQ